MKLLETEAVVLRRKKISSHDSFLTLFTRSLGRIEVFARNANYPKSPLLAGSQPFVYGLFSLSGRSNFQLRSVEVFQNFYRLREDYTNVLAASYLVQTVLQLTQEKDSNKALFESLVNSLALLEKFPELHDAILVHFYAVCIKQMGIKPQIGTCLICQAKPAPFFEISAGGTFCSDHQTPESFEAETELGLFDLALRLSIKDFLNRQDPADDLKQLQRIQEDYLDFHLESHLRDTRNHLDDYL